MKGISFLLLQRKRHSCYVTAYLSSRFRRSEFSCLRIQKYFSPFRNFQILSLKSTGNGSFYDKSRQNYRSNSKEFDLSTSILTFLFLASFTFRSISENRFETQSICESQNCNSSRSSISAVTEELLQVLRDDQVEVDVEELRSRGKPAHSHHYCSVSPDVIVFPESTEDVSKILEICCRFNFPVVAFGGGTSIEGHTLTPHGGLSLDLNRMKRVVSIHPADLDMTVEAGLGYVELNELLKEKGLWFPLDPGPGASVGGMCACRCSGSTAVRYGSMRENVLSLTAVLADGTVVKTGHRARKSSAGYDITRLFIGSEGTLGIVTEVTLKIHPLPKVSHALRVSFPGERGVVAAAATARDTLSCGVLVGRCELMDDSMITIINASNSNLAQTGKLFPVATTLLYELPGVSDAAVAESTEIIRKIAERHGCADVVVERDEAGCRELWRMRKEALWSALAAYPDREALITDVCVPLSELPGIISNTKKEILKLGIPCPIVAHAGDGNFHVLVMFKRNDEEEVRRVSEFAKRMASEAISLGGTCTGEHGVGSGKKDQLRQEIGPGGMKVIELVKDALDPGYILNPGKIFDRSIGGPKTGRFCT